MKQFVVLGLGNFGYNVAISLIENKQQVVVIDDDKSKINEIKDKVTMAVCMDVTDKSSLVKFIDNNFDCAIVSLGDRMEASTMVTMHLKEIGVRRVIAKAYSEDHTKVLKKIGADEIILPEKDTAVRLAKSLSQPNILEYLPLSEDHSVITINVPSEFVGNNLIQLNLRKKYHVQVIGIKHSESDKINIVPEPNYKLKKKDNLIIAGKDYDLKKIQDLA